MDLRRINSHILKHYSQNKFNIIKMPIYRDVLVYLHIPLKLYLNDINLFTDIY